MNTPVNLALTSREEFDIFEIWNRVWRRRWLVVGVAAACVAAAVTYALLATPIYRAEVVVVEVRDDGMGGAASLANQLGGLASIVGVNLTGAGGDNNGKAVLESRRLSEEFIRRYVPIEQLIKKPGPKRTVWRAVEEFRNGIMQIRDEARSGKITVSIDWEDPATAAQFANQYVALANELVRSHTLAEATRNIKYLNEQAEKTTIVELRRVMFNLIETETKRLMLANSRSEYAFAVVDPAVAPEVRSSPRRVRIVITFALVGGFLGALLALAVDAYSRRRRPLA